MEENIHINFVAANGEQLKTLGYCLIDIEIGQLKLKHKCIIIENLATELLLGTDILVNRGMIINFLNKTLSIGKISTKIYTEEKINNFCLTSKSDINIPAQSTHRIFQNSY